MRDKKYVIPAIVLALAATVVLFLIRPSRQQTGFRADPALQSSLDGITQDFRKIIVLVDGADALDDASRTRAIAAGQMIFWRKHQALDDVTANLVAQYQESARVRFRRGADGVRQLLQYLAANPGANPQLHDADKLAFLDLVEELESAVPPSPANRNALVNSVRALGDNLRSIQLAYREEVTRIFSQFATRGATATREKWDAYVAALRKKLTRDRILAEFDDTVGESTGFRGAPSKDGNEIFGTDFAPKSVALTFDDGPHPRYTEQVLALLRKYGLRACFFELGVNLGTVDASGQASLSRTGEISKKVLDAGHVIANHTFSHRVLTKLTEAERSSEFDRTDLLLQKVAGRKPLLFRAPYGARNSEILKEVNADGLRSVMWTIDSLDWADPVPESIAMRVLHELQQKQKG